jgi:purine-binding chemotaxis protein CheW
VTALQLLLFRCGGQVLAVDSGAVREILAASQATRIPGAPSAVRGLVNVRGTLVPVVDMADAVGLGESHGTAGTLVIVERNDKPVALAVDEVLDLVTVQASALDDRASLPGVRPDLVRAVGSAGGYSFVQLATDALLEPLLP